MLLDATVAVIAPGFGKVAITLLPCPWNISLLYKTKQERSDKFRLSARMGSKD